MELIELPHLAIGAPTEVAVAGIPQIAMRDLLEAARRIEACGKLVGERLVVHEAVVAGGADGLFVEALRRRARGLRCERSPPRPARRGFRNSPGNCSAQICELSVMGGQRCEMLLSAGRRCRKRRRGTERRRSEHRRLGKDTPTPYAVAPSLLPRRPRRSRRRKSAPAAFVSSTATRQTPSSGYLLNTARRTLSSSKEPNFGVKPRSVRMSSRCVWTISGDVYQLRLLRKLETMLRLALHLD